jgi:choline-sulfatase
LTLFPSDRYISDIGGENMKQSTGTPPNILVIMTDQMTPFMLGTYGHPAVKTPNLDALAQQGTRFDAAYSPIPICVPARASLMTGLYASHMDCHDNGDSFPSHIPTFAHYLTNQGYDTVLSGKMHFIGADQLHGFRTRLTTDIYPSTYDWSYDVPGDETELLAFNFHEQYQQENIGPGRTLELQFDEETHFRSKEYLHQSHDQPFLLVSSYTNPHPPFIAPQAYWDMYADADLAIPDYPDNMGETFSEFDHALMRWHGVDRHDIGSPANLLHMRRGYAAVISYIDDKVGELLETLKACGLRDNTAIIFCADHGDMLGEKGMIQKRSLYEWSARIPLLIDLPDRLQPSKIDQPVSLIDLHPTLLDIAGVPTNQRTPHDGHSLKPLINNASPERRPVFCEYHAEGVMQPSFMVRLGRYKYNYFHRRNSQLFDLTADPNEWHNLAGLPEYDAIEQELKALVLSHFNVDDITTTIAARLEQKKIVRQAMHQNATHWDYQPYFDATQQYMRTGLDDPYQRK